MPIRFSKIYADRQKIAAREFSASNFIPFHYYYDDSTLISEKADKLLRVVSIGGFSFETADDEDLDNLKYSMNNLLKSLPTSNFGIYIHIVRQQQQIYPDDYTAADMPDGFAKDLDMRWFERNKKHKSFANEIYISLVSKVGMGVEDLLGTIFNSGSAAEKKRQQMERIKETIEQLDESTNRILNSLRTYNPKLLSVKPTDHGNYCEISEFISKIANCGKSQKILTSGNKISDAVCNSRIYFGKNSIEIKQQDGTSMFAGMVSMREYGSTTWVGMLDMFLRVPFECIITQSIEFSERRGAIYQMQLQQNRMYQAGEKAMSQVEEITYAIDCAASGQIGFGKHHLTIMGKAPTIKQLENIMSMIMVEMTNTGGISVRERVNMEPAFWGQIPGNFDFIVRKATINTLNFASLNSLHNYPLGKADGNYWGKAVTVLDTTSGTPFFFSFHGNGRDVGHTTIIGPTGAGKTVLMNFLCAQAQRFKCRLFFFDKDRGAEIFLRALGGNYTVINPGRPCGFNPLRLPDTGENRTFLMDWLKALISVNGEQITAEDIATISAAINGNYKLKLEDRRLSNIAPFFGLEGPGTIAGRLAMWLGNGSHAKIFDNTVDIIDFGVSNIFGFEMAELLKDKASLGPVLMYIFHRINISLDGTPCMIVLDEAWALIDNPVFAPRIKDWLKVLRKLNTFVVFATQSVEDASKSSISDTLIQQTATQIFLPNLKATSSYRTVFMLSEREYQLIKTTDPGSRFFLIKQGGDAVIAKVDLSGMGDIVNILSGRAETVVILDEICKQYGDDPKVWIPKFLEKIKEQNER